MKKAMFVSKNLIGDALNIAPALQAWHQSHPDWEIDLYTIPDHVAPLYARMGVPLRVFEGMGGGLEGDALIEQLGKHYDFAHWFDVTRAFHLGDVGRYHITQGYSEALEVGYTGPGLTYLADDISEEYCFVTAGGPQDYILVSMFSRSCTSQEKNSEGNYVGNPPNKMLPMEKWSPILRWLRTLGYPLRFLGAKDNRDEVWMKYLGVTDEELLMGYELNTIAAVMKNNTKMLVTIDNGMSHLGATQQTPTLLFYPACLGMHFIVPWGNLNVRPIHMDPAAVRTDGLLRLVQKVTPELLGMTRYNTS